MNIDINVALEHLDIINERNRMAVEDDGIDADTIQFSDPGQRDEIVDMIENESGAELSHDEAVAIYDMIKAKLI